MPCPGTPKGASLVPRCLLRADGDSWELSPCLATGAIVPRLLLYPFITPRAAAVGWLILQTPVPAAPTSKPFPGEGCLGSRRWRPRGDRQQWEQFAEFKRSTPPSASPMHFIPMQNSEVKIQLCLFTACVPMWYESARGRGTHL